MRIRIGYVGGSHAEGGPSDWPAMRSEGVDWIEVDGVRIQGQSVYWLRSVPEGYRAGGAAFYSQAPFEVEVTEAGQREVPITDETVPDLHHDDVKLGWWWHG